MLGRESPTRSVKAFTLQGGRCPWCWRPLPEDLAGVQTELIIPVSRGGLDTEWNQQLLHSACRAERHVARTAEAA
jgi:hypothetical protein